jgi:hypothetical protein
MSLAVVLTILVLAITVLIDICIDFLFTYLKSKCWTLVFIAALYIIAFGLMFSIGKTSHTVSF